MLAKSNYLEAAVIEAALRSVAFDGPSTVYMALHTASPGETGATAEVSGNAYARTAIAFGANSGGTCTNVGMTTFPAPTPSNWGTLTHFSLWDASSGGNCLYYGSLTSSIVTAVGVSPNFLAGSVVITEGNPEGIAFDATTLHPSYIDGFRAADYADMTAFNADRASRGYTFLSDVNVSRVGDMLRIGQNGEINSDLVFTPRHEVWFRWAVTLNPSWPSEARMILSFVACDWNDFAATNGFDLYNADTEEFSGYNHPAPVSYPLASLRGIETYMICRGRGQLGATAPTTTVWIGAAGDPEASLLLPETSVLPIDHDGIGLSGTFLTTTSYWPGGVFTPGGHPDATADVRLMEFVPGDGTYPYTGLEAE